jgi:Arc/MetJ-type ribon-helix-helix transcriptional regulator
MDIEITLTGPEREFVDQRLRLGRASSVGEVLREALQFMMDREGHERRRYDAWREDARRKIDEACEESPGSSVDGPALFEELRLEIEALRERGL